MEKSNNLYIVTSDIGLRVRSSPEIPTKSQKDNRIGSLAYKEEVIVINTIGGWSLIPYKDGQGWVSNLYLVKKENVPTTSSKVIGQKIPLDLQVPVFIKGEPNYKDSKNTVLLRKIINDVLNGGKNGYDLQCTEYVQYKIKMLNITIKWPISSGRDGGKWARIFEQHGLYKVSGKPGVNCAMSFTGGLEKTSAKNTGHVAFVEKVFGDESIYIFEANWPGSGKYNERILKKSDWQDKYKGRFVDFLTY